MTSHTLVTVTPRRWRTGLTVAIDRHLCERIWMERLEARVLMAGQIDPTFGEGGIARGPRIDGNDLTIVALLPQPDGTTIAEATNSRATHRYIARFDKDGHVDLSLGTNGLTLLKQKEVYIQWESFYGQIMVDHLGRILLPSGNTVAPFEQSVVVSRYNPDGSPDATWAGDGEVEVPIPSRIWMDAEARGAVEDSLGRITVAVRNSDGDKVHFFLLRFNPDGSMDQSFGDNGIVLVTPPVGTGFSGRLIQDAQGRLVITGSIARIDQHPVAALARLNADGSSDPTFGDAGWFVTDFGRTYASFRVAEFDSKGRIVIRFIRERPHDPLPTYVEHGVLRLTPDGLLDSSFGLGSGEYVFRSWDEPLVTGGYTFKLAVQPDDKILTTYNRRGKYWFGDDYILRLNDDGTRDTSFGDGGSIPGLSTPLGFYPPNDIAFVNDRLLLAGATFDSFTLEPPFPHSGSWSVTGIVANDPNRTEPDMPTDDDSGQTPDEHTPTEPDPVIAVMPPQRTAASLFVSHAATSRAPNIVDSKFTDDLLAPIADDLLR